MTLTGWKKERTHVVKVIGRDRIQLEKLEETVQDRLVKVKDDVDAATSLALLINFGFITDALVWQLCRFLEQIRMHAGFALEKLRAVEARLKHNLAYLAEFDRTPFKPTPNIQTDL